MWHRAGGDPLKSKKPPLDPTVANTVARVLDQHPSAREHTIESHMPLLRAHAVYSAALAARYREFDLSTGRFNLLKLLYQSDPEALTISQIAAYLGISAPSALRMVQVLEGESWLRSKKSPSDRRVTFVEFTPDGRARFDQVLPRVLSIWEDLWSGLSEEESQVLTGLLARLRSDLLARYIGEQGLAAFRAAEQQQPERPED